MPNPMSVYACPTCKGSLIAAENSLQCESCTTVYPIVNKIPDFLGEDRERSLGGFTRFLLRLIVSLYETPLWYVPILKLAGGKGAPRYGEVIRQMVNLMDVHDGLLLDVACGPGTWGRRQASSTMRVYGIDISWSMLRQGMRMMHAKGISNMHFAHAQVEALPFHDTQFDAAYCGGALHGFPDPAGALLEIGRTLKPGAPLVVLTFLDRGQPLIQKRKKAEIHNEKLVKMHFFEVDQVDQMLYQAGFAGIEPQVFGGVIIFRTRKRN